MKDKMNFNDYTDDELIKKFTIEKNGHKFIPAAIMNEIGRRRVKRANRKSGDPGTKENPIFRNGRAYVYGSLDQLILWEDYKGLVPVGKGVTVNINPSTTEMMTLTRDMQPTEAQKRMVRLAAGMDITFSDDCPKSSPEQIERFKKNGRAKISSLKKSLKT